MELGQRGYCTIKFTPPCTFPDLSADDGGALSFWTPNHHSQTSGTPNQQFASNIHQRSDSQVGMDGPSKTSQDDDTKRRRRRLVKQVASDLREALREDNLDIPDILLDQAIATLTNARNSTSSTTKERPRSVHGHARTPSDPNIEAPTVWMRLRHTSKPTAGFRVQCPNSLSQITQLGAVQAGSLIANVTRGLADARLKQLVVEHLNGSNDPASVGSPFISFFAHEAAAEQWASRWSDLNEGASCSILGIDPAKITRLFSVRELVQHLGISEQDVTQGLGGHEDEYLVVHQIPGEAIVKQMVMRGRTSTVPEGDELDESLPTRIPEVPQTEADLAERLVQQIAISEPPSESANHIRTRGGSKGLIPNTNLPLEVRDTQ